RISHSQIIQQAGLSCYGQGGEFRDPDLRFPKPALCLLSYTLIRLFMCPFPTARSLSTDTLRLVNVKRQSSDYYGDHRSVCHFLDKTTYGRLRTIRRRSPP